MKKISLALAALMLVISAFFAACGGADDGKVSDATSDRADITTTANISDTREDVTDMLTSASEFLSPSSSQNAAPSDNVTR